jgi:hypothetical protein
MRALIDSSAADHLVEPPEAFAAVKAAIQSGELELLLTPIAYRELAATTDETKRAKLMALADLCARTLDGAFVFDQSRFDESRFGRDTIVGHMVDGNNRHSKDASIASAANLDGVPLVTSDEHQREQAQSAMMWVISPARLLERIGYAAPDDAEKPPE